MIPAALFGAATPGLHAQINAPGYSIADADYYPRLYLDERTGTVTVTVNRQGDFQVPSSVHYRVTTNSASWGLGLATAGMDFLPANLSLSIGATAAFRVTATTTNGPMACQWRHQDAPLVKAKNVSLILPNIQPTDPDALTQAVRFYRVRQLRQ